MLALPLGRSAWAPSTCLLVALTVLLSVAWPAGASAQDDPAYQSVIAEAVQEFGAGHWAEARALFKRAHKMSPNARTLRGMGMCAYELRMYVPALRELQGALQERRRPLSAEQRTQVSSLIGHAANFVGRYRVSVTPADATITVDAKPAQFDPGNLLFLELGEHTLVASKKGYESATQKVRVEGAENSELHIELMPTVTAAAAPPPQAQPAQPQPAAPPVAEPQAQPAPEPEPEPAAPPPPAAEERGPGLAIAGWIGIGLAAAAGVAAGVYWAQGNTAIADLEAFCGKDAANPNTCRQEDFDEVQIEQLDTAATVSMVAAVVLGVTGITLLTIDGVLGDGGGETADAGASIRLTPGALLVEGSF